MRKPRLTDKVKRGLWLIIARSPTLYSAENGAPGMEREERDAILAAGRYAESHWGARNTLAQSYKDEGID
jgi:hypothetical protein